MEFDYICYVIGVMGMLMTTTWFFGGIIYNVTNGKKTNKKWVALIATLLSMNTIILFFGGNTWVDKQYTQNVLRDRQTTEEFLNGLRKVSVKGEEITLIDRNGDAWVIFVD